MRYDGLCAVATYLRNRPPTLSHTQRPHSPTVPVPFTASSFTARGDLVQSGADSYHYSLYPDLTRINYWARESECWRGTPPDRRIYTLTIPGVSTAAESSRSIVAPIGAASVALAVAAPITTKLGPVVALAGGGPRRKDAILSPPENASVK